MLKAGSSTRSDKVAQGFVQQSLENLQGWRQQNLHEKHALHLDCPHGEKVSLYMQSEHLLFHFMPVFFSFSHHVPLWKAWLCLFNDVLLGTGGLLLGTLKPHLISSRLNNSRSLSISSQANSPALSILLVFCWICSGLSMSFIFGAPD